MLNGSRIVVFGVIQLPSLLAVNVPLARQVLEVHGWAALLLLALIGHRFSDLLASLPSGLKRPHPLVPEALNCDWHSLEESASDNHVHHGFSQPEPAPIGYIFGAY